MSIADKLNTLQTIKTNIKTAIENKGVDVGDAPFTEYSNKIANIEGGSSELEQTITLIPTYNYSLQLQQCKTEGIIEIDCKNLTKTPIFGGLLFSNRGGLKMKNTSNLTVCQQMYYNTNVVEPFLFDTSNVTDMTNMFYGCGNLETIPQFNTSNVTDMTSMFYNCGNLETLPLLNMSKVSSNNSMFKYCTKLTNLGGFEGLKIDINLSASELITRQSMLNVFNTIGEANSTITIHQNVADRLTDEDKAIATNKGWTITA